MDIETYLTVSEVAHALKIWPETVRAWIHQGKLGGVKLPGGDWRIRREDLDEMLGEPAGARR